MDEIFNKKPEPNEDEDDIEGNTIKYASDKRKEIKEAIQIRDQNEGKTDSKQ